MTSMTHGERELSMRRRISCALGALALGFVTGQAQAQEFTPASRTAAPPTTIINLDNDTGISIPLARPNAARTPAVSHDTGISVPVPRPSVARTPIVSIGD